MAQIISSCIIGCLLWPACSLDKAVSLCLASFCTSRPSFPITPGIFSYPTFALQFPVMKRTCFLVLEGLVGLHRTGEVGKTTRPFGYNLNQIPYDPTVEVMNRFKELDMIDKECLKNCGERFVTLNRKQWLKPSQRKRNTRKQHGGLRRFYK